MKDLDLRFSFKEPKDLYKKAMIIVLFESVKISPCFHEVTVL